MIIQHLHIQQTNACLKLQINAHKSSTYLLLLSQDILTPEKVWLDPNNTFWGGMTGCLGYIYIQKETWSILVYTIYTCPSRIFGENAQHPALKTTTAMVWRVHWAEKGGLLKRTFLCNHGNVWCPSISILHSAGIKKLFETRNFSWYRNPWTTLSRTSTFNCPYNIYNYEAAWCSTPTLLLICWSFSAENGYPYLFCSSLSRAQIGYSLGRSRMHTCQTHQHHWHSIAMFGSKYVLSPFPVIFRTD